MARKPAAKAPVTAEKFTAENLKNLLKQERVVRQGKLPSAVGLQALAHDLAGYQRYVSLQTGPWRASNQRTTRIAAAIKTLANDLPALCADAGKAVQFAGSRNKSDVMGRLLQRQHKAFVDLLANIEAIKRDATLSLLLVPLSAMVGSVERWPELAPTLADLFTKAMRTTNPGWTFGLSNEGPIPRFIEAVIPWITGEAPTALAVGQFFKRRAKKTGTLGTA